MSCSFESQPVVFPALNYPVFGLFIKVWLFWVHPRLLLMCVLVTVRWYVRFELDILKAKSLVGNKDKDLSLSAFLALSEVMLRLAHPLSQAASNCVTPLTSWFNISHSQLHWIAFTHCNTYISVFFSVLTMLSFTGTGPHYDLPLLYYKQYYVTYRKWPQAKTLPSLLNVWH